jgi:hypothetical protein
LTSLAAGCRFPARGVRLGDVPPRHATRQAASHVPTQDLRANDGVLRANDVAKLAPEQSVLKREIGDPIRLGAAQFELLSNAFLAEIESRFLRPAPAPATRPNFQHGDPAPV